MELKNYMKEVTDTLKKSGAQRASFHLHLMIEDNKIEVAPYGSDINFKVKINES